MHNNKNNLEYIYVRHGGKDGVRSAESRSTESRSTESRSTESRSHGVRSTESRSHEVRSHGVRSHGVRSQDGVRSLSVKCSPRRGGDF